jgi:quercetin dioxygenase-like cupin family protein
MDVFDWQTKESKDAGESGVQIRWLVGPDDSAPRFAMRLFELEPGASIPVHQHWYEQEMFFLEGEAVVVDNEGAETSARKGTVVWIKSNEPHGFRNDGVGTVRFLCCVPIARPR